MADSVTANYGFVKPEIDASDDTWGIKLNADLDEIDEQLKAVSDIANAAAANLGYKVLYYGTAVDVPRLTFTDIPIDVTGLKGIKIIAVNVAHTVAGGWVGSVQAKLKSSLGASGAFALNYWPATGVTTAQNGVVEIFAMGDGDNPLGVDFLFGHTSVQKKDTGTGDLLDLLQNESGIGFEATHLNLSISTFSASGTFTIGKLLVLGF